MGTNPTISFLVVVRNESKYIETCVKSMLNQTVDPDDYEIIVVDGMSIDGTPDIVRRMIEQNPKRDIRMVDNPAKILSTGWNIGIKLARGEYVIRPDAHAEVSTDFLEKNLHVMRQHPEASAVGGEMRTIGTGFWGEMIAYALSTKMGVGASTFRVGGTSGPADTVVFGLYKKRDLLNVGGFDESIPLNQDNVCHGKLKAAGGILYFDPSITSTYYCRSNLGALWRQMFRRSFWLVRMLKHQREQSLALRYFIPLVFVMSVLLPIFLSPLWPVVLAIPVAALCAYCTMAIAFSIKSHLSLLQKLSLPLVYLVIHVAYGLGMFVGFTSLPFYKIKMLKSEDISKALS